jgi:hypothetical protein
VLVLSETVLVIERNSLEMNQELKVKRVRIVSKLTRLAMNYENTTEPESAYALSSEYEYEYEHV